MLLQKEVVPRILHGSKHAYPEARMGWFVFELPAQFQQDSFSIGCSLQLASKLACRLSNESHSQPCNCCSITIVELKHMVPKLVPA